MVGRQDTLQRDETVTEEDLGGTFCVAGGDAFYIEHSIENRGLRIDPPSLFGYGGQGIRIAMAMCTSDRGRGLCDAQCLRSGYALCERIVAGVG